MSSEPERTYSNGEVTIEWRPEKCIHCTSCLVNLPEVFDMGRRPWVNINGAKASDIRDAVKLCPSGALSIPGMVAED